MDRPDIEAIEKRVKNAKDLLARKGDNYHIVGTQFFIDNTQPLIAYARELEQRIQEMQVDRDSLERD